MAEHSSAARGKQVVHDVEKKVRAVRRPRYAVAVIDRLRAGWLALGLLPCLFDLPAGATDTAAGTAGAADASRSVVATPARAGTGGPTPTPTPTPAAAPSPRALASLWNAQ